MSGLTLATASSTWASSECSPESHRPLFWPPLGNLFKGILPLVTVPRQEGGVHPHLELSLPGTGFVVMHMEVQRAPATATDEGKEAQEGMQCPSRRVPQVRSQQGTPAPQAEATRGCPEEPVCQAPRRTMARWQSHITRTLGLSGCNATSHLCPPPPTPSPTCCTLASLGWGHEVKQQWAQEPLQQS